MGKAEKFGALRRAQLEGDHDKLSKFGKKGASHKIQLEDLRAAQRAQDFADIEKLGKMNTEGDVLPPAPRTDD